MYYYLALIFNLFKVLIILLILLFIISILNFNYINLIILSIIFQNVKIFPWLVNYIFIFKLKL
jgi:hypothetical protein